MANKKMRLSMPNWSGLPIHLLELIVKKLSFLEILQFRAVCRSWNTAAKSHVFSALLVIPRNQTETYDGNNHNNNTLPPQFFSLAGKTLYSFENSFQELNDCCCVGSSHAWLVLLDKRSNPFAFNLFSREKIDLPLITGHIHKAILIFSDSKEKKKKNKTAVVLIHGLITTKLSYCNVGDESWTDLNCENSPYSDITSYGNRLYALSYSNSIEVLDFKSDSFPKKVMNFVPSGVLVPSLTAGNYSKNKYFVKKYLVKSMGEEEILLVTRFIGYRANAYGELLEEGDLLTDDDTHPVVCPYRTVESCVHKMDLSGRRWEKVESFEDRAVFVGGNESLSVSTQNLAGFEGNSIYFTDDDWEDMTVDYLYGGHDIGVYNLERKVVTACYEFDDGKVFPPPFWIVLNPQ